MDGTVDESFTDFTCVKVMFVVMLVIPKIPVWGYISSKLPRK